MAVVTWLHLSDLHFQADGQHDRQVVLDALWKDIRERVKRISSELEQIDFILFTGDIAYQGITAEYELAVKIFWLYADLWDKIRHGRTPREPVNGSCQSSGSRKRD